MQNAIADVSEIGDLLRSVSEARQVPFELLCSALEEAVASAYQEHAGADNVVARVDRSSAAIALHRRRLVVDELTDASSQVLATAAPPGYRAGDFLDEPVAIGDFARVAALTAKHVLAQRVAQFERERVYESYRERIGQLFTGLVQREIRGNVYLLFEDGNEGVLPAYARSSREPIAINDMIVAELEGVWRTSRGPALTLSRASESFVRKLLDVPHVVAGARFPGRVTLLATTRTIAPSLVAEVSRQIAGEPIRIVQYHDDVDVMLAQILPPNAIDRTHRIEATRTIVIATEENVDVELAARLVGWRIVTASSADFEEAIASCDLEKPEVSEPKASSEITDDMRRTLESFRASINSEP